MRRFFLYFLLALTRIVADLPLLWMFFFLHFQEKGSGGISEGLANAGLLVSFGLLHSVLARDFGKRWLANLVGEEYVRRLYVWVGAGTLALLLYFWQPLSGTVWQARGAGYWVLTAAYLACITGLIYTTFFIDYADFLGIRSLLRRLRNQPPKPPLFSVQGPYAYCRHPMYVFLLGVFWIGPTMTYGRLEFALLGSLYLLLGSIFEERNLRAELGNVYDLYRANVPMWIPRLHPWKYPPAE